MQNATHMFNEIREIPEAGARLLGEGRSVIREAARALREADPRVVATIARGSSDHASTYLKYAIELTTGTPVASVGPSVASIYKAPLRLEGGAAIAVSQSGKSPDIVAMAEAARAGGAIAIAITNTADSPLARVADFTIDLHAGTERSVAATKTFVSSVLAGLALLAHWTEDQALIGAVERLPEAFAQAIDCDWSDLVETLKGESALYVLGRGPGFAIANEAALKFKETCGIQGEAFSAAEVLHGPVSIVTPGYPVLALAARDAAEASVAGMAHTLADRGAAVFLTSDEAGSARRLPFAPSGHPITDPLCLIVSFYAFVERLARARGLDPDTPPMLKKVTETV